jgi:hypothetical protein
MEDIIGGMLGWLAKLARFVPGTPVPARMALPTGIHQLRLLSTTGFEIYKWRAKQTSKAAMGAVSTYGNVNKGYMRISHIYSALVNSKQNISIEGVQNKHEQGLQG